MSKKRKKAPEPKTEDQNTNHGRRIMVKSDGDWTVWRFEFDAGDGQGVAWHQGRSFGPANSIEATTRHFVDRGYTVVDWQENV